MSEQNSPKNIKKNKFMLVAGPTVIVLVGAFYYLSGGRYETTDNAYLKSDKTAISAEVSGKAKQVLVSNNAAVQVGQTLMIIDEEPFLIARDHAQASLLSVKNDIDSLKTDYAQKVAAVRIAKDNLTFYEKEFVRYRNLSHDKVVPLSRFDQAVKERDNATQQLVTAEQDLQGIKAKLIDPDLPTEQHPLYLKALAELSQANLDLERINIKAPSDGVVANFYLEPGEFINAGAPLFTLVKDKHVWVEANYKETDLTHVRPGQEATITVDTYPSKVWKAKVASITPATGAEFSVLPLQNTSGNWVKVVQRIMVRLELEDYDGNPPLKAGMSTNVSIDTGYSRLSRMMGADRE